MKKLWLIILVMAVAFVSIIATGGGIENKKASGIKTDGLLAERKASAEYVAMLGHSQVTSSPIHEGALYFAELVFEKTGGRVVVEVYPSAQLGAERDLIESVGMGAVTMGMSIASVCAQFQPGVEAVCLPFLFETKEDVYRVLDGEAGRRLFSAMEKSDVTVMASFENGFRQLGSNRAVNSIEDLSGLKLRAPEGDIYTKTWSALGVNVTATPWSETFTALQTGVVDGEEAPLAIFNSSGFGEVTKFFAYINYMYDPMLVYFNSRWLDALPAELRKAVTESAQEAANFQRGLVTEQEAEAENILKGKWGVTFTHPDLAPFREACESVYDTYGHQDKLKLIRDALDS